MQHSLTILNIWKVTHNVRRYALEKPKGYIFKPGQATDVSIDRDGYRDRKNPFTFTALNDWDYLEFTIKSYFDHDGVTKALWELSPGDRLIVREPWGTITYKGPGTFLAGGAGVTMARMISATANTPTRAGTTSMPPSRSAEPKVKRGTPPGFSMPMQEISRPSSMLATAFTGEERATRVAHIKPRKASQKYSKVEKLSATSASAGAMITSDSVPAIPPMALNQTPAPSASSAWPLRVMA